MTMYTLITGKNIVRLNGRYVAEGGFVSEINCIAARLGKMRLICPCSAKNEFPGGKELSREIEVFELWAPQSFLFYLPATLLYMLKLPFLLRGATGCFCYVPSMTPVGALGVLWCRLIGARLVIADRGSVVSAMRNSGVDCKHLPVFWWNRLWEYLTFGFGECFYPTFMRGDDRCREACRRGAQAVQLIGSMQTYPPFAGNDGRDHNGILFVGRLEEAKGIRVLLDAFAALTVEYPELNLTLVGHTADSENFARELQARGIANRIRLAGLLEYGEPLFAEYNRALLIVLPSFSEGVPNVILEGMSAGCIGIGSAVGGIPDTIEDGRNGFLVPPGDAAALAAAIRRVLNASTPERLAMQQAAIEKAAVFKARNSFGRMLQMIEENYRADAAGSGSRRQLLLPLGWMLAVGAVWGGHVLQFQLLPLLKKIL